MGAMFVSHWQFRPLNPNETSGASISDDNFADEERSNVEILVRESLQNPLDARSSDSVVRVEYKLVEVDLAASEFARSIFTNDWVRHFRAGGLIDNDERPARMKFLVIEDFGTTGLEGCYEDSSREGPTENWNAFWFREGEGAKTTRSNGGAGQGKITLYLASRLRTVFALTKRKTDSLELLFGCCRFRRNYKLESDPRRWAREARWGAESNPDELVKPISQGQMLPGINRELGLARGDEPGTSFIIPMPSEDITEAFLLHAVVNEFFFAINRGRLIVKVGTKTLDSTSITETANDMGKDCRLPKRYREFLAQTAQEAGTTATATAEDFWTRESKLVPAAFKEPELARLKKNLGNLNSSQWTFPWWLKRNSREKAQLRSFVFSYNRMRTRNRVKSYSFARILGSTVRSA